MVCARHLLLLSSLVWATACSQGRAPGKKPMQNDAAAPKLNRLATALSPYLKQHAGNPVDWYPWGDEALRKAREEDRPIFLSIGYSACHWCHVMERESFENKDIAALLNAHFVAIKVDREERPDLDRVYMKAVQVLTGRGGWPMSVFLTPDLKPFYGGTYFPPEDRHGSPGFRRVLTELARLWTDDRQKLLGSADQLFGYLSQTGTAGKGTLDRVPIRAAIGELAKEFDAEEGGFGGAPKFPPAGVLELLLREYRRTGDESLLRMVTKTLDAMARGGIYDQLGGGFHRYSVDDQWLVPHFEKMLYDNALLVPVYLDAWLVTGEQRFREVARETLDFVLRDMLDDSGGFHSSLDADSEGVEGKFYVWSQQEIEGILAERERKPFLRAYGVTPQGNWELGNILHLRRPLADVAASVGLSEPELVSLLAQARAKLLAVRDRRIWPHKDDKVLTAWNGLMISALARGFQVLGDERYREAAEQAAGFLLDTMVTPDGLRRVYRSGQTATAGLLDDYAYLATGLLDLFEATGDPRWLTAADTLSAEMVAGFMDSEGHGFFYSRAGDAQLILRERCFVDEAIPSPNAKAGEALLRLARLHASEKQEEQARAALIAAAGFGRQFPTALTHTWCMVDRLLAPPEELVLVAGADGTGFREMIHAAGESYRPNLTIVLVARETAGEGLRIPWLAGRTARDGMSTAYYCVDRTCAAPVTSADSLRSLLSAAD
jgi:uncharacterized protein YyaL (SSP411 family)